MSEIVDRAARRLNPAAFQTFEENPVGSLERGLAMVETAAARTDARAVIEAMRTLPECYFSVLVKTFNLRDDEVHRDAAKQWYRSMIDEALK